MDGLGRAIGDGISGLVRGSIDMIGATIRAMIAGAEAMLPAGVLPVLGVAVLVLVAWTFLKR